MTCRMNELAGHFEVKLSTTVKTLLQNKVTLVYTILGSFLPVTEQRLLFCLLQFVFGPSHRLSWLGSRVNGLNARRRLS